MDYSQAAKSVAETIEKVSGQPLTQGQFLGLAGSMAVWLEKARGEGLLAAWNGRLTPHKGDGNDKEES